MNPSIMNFLKLLQEFLIIEKKRSKRLMNLNEHRQLNHNNLESHP